MKYIVIILLSLLSCKKDDKITQNIKINPIINTKESLKIDSLKIVEKTDTLNLENKKNEEFELIVPIKNEKEDSFKNIYTDSNIILHNENLEKEPFAQHKLLFDYNNKSIEKILKFYYEYPDIEIELYNSKLNNKIIIINGIDYYSGTFGIYYIDNKFNYIKELGEFGYEQKDPERLGFKKIKAKLNTINNILNCKFYLGENLLYEKKINLE